MGKRPEQAKKIQEWKPWESDRRHKLRKPTNIVNSSAAVYEKFLNRCEKLL